MTGKGRSSDVAAPASGFAETGGEAFGRIVRDGARELGVPLGAAQVSAFERLAEWLAEWNRRMNLTAVRDPAGVAVKHVLDSLTCLVAHRFPEGARVVDVGTGAGFPGLALKIARPDLRVTLLDSTRKKLGFADYVIRSLGWTGAATLFGRAEEMGHEGKHRETYDVVVARAVAALPALSELCLPLTRTGGAFLAMKGPGAESEARAARPAIERLGGRVKSLVPFTLPADGGARTVVVAGKQRPTPEGYPRAYRDIKRFPL